jgi:hypothetical protein
VVVCFVLFCFVCNSVLYSCAANSVTLLLCGATYYLLLEFPYYLLSLYFAL